MSQQEQCHVIHGSVRDCSRELAEAIFSKIDDFDEQAAAEAMRRQDDRVSQQEWCLLCAKLIEDFFLPKGKPEPPAFESTDDPGLTTVTWED